MFTPHAAQRLAVPLVPELPLLLALVLWVVPLLAPPVAVELAVEPVVEPVALPELLESEEPPLLQPAAKAATVRVAQNEARRMESPRAAGKSPLAAELS
ncbi:MAG TPA: hypothetical protein VGL19_20980 [Polyangiaceae bacterium]